MENPFEEIVGRLQLIEMKVNMIRESIDEIKSVTGSKKAITPHLTRQEAANFFNISLNCLNDWCNKGVITKHKVGNKTYFMRDELNEVLLKRKS